MKLNIPEIAKTKIIKTGVFDSQLVESYNMENLISTTNESNLLKIQQCKVLLMQYALKTAQKHSIYLKRCQRQYSQLEIQTTKS